MNRKRLLYSCLVGFAIGFTPLLYFASFQLRHPIQIGDVTRSVLSYSMAVGFLVSIVFSGGNVHANTLGIICLADAAFYSWLTYFLLSFWRKRRAASEKPMNPS